MSGAKDSGGEPIEDATVDELEAVVDDLSGGVAMELLPRNVDTNVALGISVAIDALRDGKEEMAVACLKTAVKELEE